MFHSVIDYVVTAISDKNPADSNATTIPQNIPKVIPSTPHGYSGGAWKVAYADFVTAMMAFFLLMWLLNATTEEQRSGIADYFDPKVPISQSSAGGMGMFGGDTVFAQSKLARNGLGGAGAKASAGRNDKEKHEVSSSEDVWSKGDASSELTGNSKPTGGQGGADGKGGQSIFEKKAVEVEAEVRRQLEQVAPGNGLSKQVNFKMTDEGLRIDITDKDGVPMFESGSSSPTQKMQQIMQVVGSVVSQLENDVAITGHTDSKPFKSRRNYSNWELSSERAHAARRALVETGFDNGKIKRVEGRADREPLVPEKPDALTNRRIGIVLLRDTSLDAMQDAMGEAAQFEQDKVLQKKNRGIGSVGTSMQDLYIPDKKQF